MRNKLIDYYENCRKHYTAYHNHKEITAWAGLVLFVFISGYINSIKIPENWKIEGALLITILVSLQTFFVFRYIANQLKMKDKGGAYAAASIAIITELISERITEKQLIDFLSVEESADTDGQASHVLPHKLIKKAEILNSRGKGHQDTTKSMIYAMLTLISISLVVSKWIQTC